MSTSDNIELMKRWFQEVWNEGKLDTIRELLSPDAVATGQVGADVVMHGPKDFVPFAKSIRAAFPDIKTTVEDAFGIEDKVVVRWSATMTHRGGDLGIPATGKPVRITGMTIVRIANGKIIEGWDNWDQLAMLEQIGAYKRPETIPLAKSA
jgi:steroid delta-isomerase-like uncharacterized protein